MGLFSRKSKEPQEPTAQSPGEEGEVRLSVDELKLRGDADGLLDVLRSSADEDERIKAAWALVDVGDERGEEALVGIVSSAAEPSGVRFQAVGALGKMHSTEAVEPLVEVLSDSREDDKVRTGAAVSLGWIGDHKAAEPLAKVWLKADDERLQDAAGRAFMELDVTRSEYLVEALEDPECCAEAATRLARFADESVLPALGRVLDQAEANKAKRDAAAAREAIQIIRGRAA